METLSHRKAKAENQKFIKFFLLYGIFGSALIISVLFSLGSRYFGCKKTSLVQEAVETEILIESEI